MFKEFAGIPLANMLWQIQVTGNTLWTPYTQTSVCIFSILFSKHFLRSWQGEFVLKSRVSLVGDHFPYSCDLTVWCRGDIERRIKMLVTVRDQGVNLHLKLFRILKIQIHLQYSCLHYIQHDLMYLISNDISPEYCASYVTVLCYIFSSLEGKYQNHWQCFQVAAVMLTSLVHLLLRFYFGSETALYKVAMINFFQSFGTKQNLANQNLILKATSCASYNLFLSLLLFLLVEVAGFTIPTLTAVVIT